MSDLIERLEEYNKDWRTRAGSAKEVAEAIAEIKHLRRNLHNEQMASLSASEAACYRWAEDTDEHRALRAAFTDGATHVAASQSREGLISCAKRYMSAVKRLGEDSGFNKLTFFEAPILHMPTDAMRDDAIGRWHELNDAGVALSNAVLDKTTAPS